MDSNEVVPAQATGLSVHVNSGSLQQLTEQRNLLRQFIKQNLTKDVDYGVIPGTPKDSLYKPGAEKIANIFQLGSRIIDKDKTLDLKENFAMFSITVEVFHLPTGKAIAQCEGVANSQEVKYRERKVWIGSGSNRRQEREATPVADILNTLSKMAQKRAYVGAVIIATGASDFFTQDMEDQELGPKDPPKAPPIVAPKTKPPEGSDLGTYVVQFGTKWKGKTLNEMGADEVRGFMNFLVSSAAKDKKQPGGLVKEFIDTATKWLGE